MDNPPPYSSPTTPPHQPGQVIGPGDQHTYTPPASYSLSQAVIPAAPVYPLPQPAVPAKPRFRFNLLSLTIVVLIAVLISGGVFTYESASKKASPKENLTAATSGTQKTITATKPSSPKSNTQKTTQPPKTTNKISTSTSTSAPNQLPAVVTPTYTGTLPNTTPVYSYNGWNFYYAGSRQYVSASGASVNLSIAQPEVTQSSGTENHSLMEMSLADNVQKQIVEIGWLVDQVLNGDSLPHLFVYHWISGQSSCYNGCGFVQTSSVIVPGQALTPGSNGTFQINFSSNQWNFYYNGTYFGYFPESLWGGNFTQAGFIQTFGEVEIGASSTTQCVQMGNGIAGNKTGSARISNFTLLGSTTIPALSPYATSPSTFSYGSASATGVNIGGPGGC